MAKSIKCIVVNETDYDMVSTLDDKDGKRLNFQVIKGGFAEGTPGNPPSPPLLVPKKSQIEFTVTDEPEGWVVWELAELKVVVNIFWKDPGDGKNDFCVWGNYWHTKAGAFGGDVTFEDEKCNALQLDDVKKAESFVARFGVRLGPIVGQLIAATPDATCTVAKPKVPLDWVKPLSDRRKLMLATIGRMIPQKSSPSMKPPELCTLYDQGGNWQSSDAWWGWLWVPNPKFDASQPESKTNKKQLWELHPDRIMQTSCTSYQPLVMAAYFGEVGKVVVGGHIWGFSIPGSDLNPKEKPFPGWKLAKDHPSERPKPGDSYIVWTDYKGSEPAGEGHVGHIVYVPEPGDEDDCWVMADGGQGGRGAQTSNLVWAVLMRAAGDPPKSEDTSGTNCSLVYPEAPFICGGAERMTAPRRFCGWVDMDDTGLPDPPGLGKHSEQDLAGLVTRIDNVRAYFKANEADNCKKTIAAGLPYNVAGTLGKFSSKRWP